MPARTHSSSSLLAPQAVTHPSIHVTERWVHPVTGQLVAVTLIYVAPLSFLFLLWWRDYVCSLPIRKVYSARNGGPVWELSQTGVGRSTPAWAKPSYRLPALAASLYITAFTPLSSKPGCLRPIAHVYCPHCYSYTSQHIVKGYKPQIPVSFNSEMVSTDLYMGH